MADERDTIDMSAPQRITPIPSLEAEEPRRGNGVLIVAVAAILVLVAAIGAAVVFLGGNGATTATATADAVTAAAAPATDPPSSAESTTAESVSTSTPAMAPANTGPAVAAPAASAPADTADASSASADAPGPAAETAPAAPPTPSAPPAPAATGPFKPQPIGDWLLLCPEPATFGPDCLLQQELRSSRTKRLVAVWALKRDVSGKLRAVFQLPPSILADKGLVLGSGTAEPRLLPISNCSTQMCVARAEFDVEALNQLIAAPALGVSVVLKGADGAEGKPLVLNFSTKGLGVGATKLMP